MKRKYENVCQFKIVLEGIEPAVWRRIQVPGTYTFWDLHVAIQDSMGWRDSHLHQFTIKNPSTGVMDLIGIPDEDLVEELEVLPGWKKKVIDYFLNAGASARYLYDFGDHWEQSIELEEIRPRQQGVRYPLCIDGRRACPPEDCGGYMGFTIS